MDLDDIHTSRDLRTNPFTGVFRRRRYQRVIKVAPWLLSGKGLTRNL